MTNWWDCAGEATNVKSLSTGINTPGAGTREWIASHVEGRVLDIGCGTGELAALLLDREDVRYTGIDGSEQMVRTCQQRFPEQQNRFTHGDIENLPMKGRIWMYDIAVARHVIDHLPDYHKAIAEMHRVARRVVVVLFNPLGIEAETWMEEHDARVVTKSHDDGLYEAVGTSPDDVIHIGIETILLGAKA